jgi:hypothetical protein
MDKKPERKVIREGKFEIVIEEGDHFYLVDKKDKICVLPYTIDTRGLLDKIGVMEDWNITEKSKVITILSDYVNSDDDTDLLSANRILFDITGVNITEADRWMFLGAIYSNMASESELQIYAVNITDIKIKEDEEVDEEKKAKRFKMMDSSKVLQSDDMTFLASYLRLFEYFYVNSLNNE